MVLDHVLDTLTCMNTVSYFLHKHRSRPTLHTAKPTIKNRNGLKRVLLFAFLGFLEDGFKQQCIFCQPYKTYKTYKTYTKPTRPTYTTRLIRPTKPATRPANNNKKIYIIVHTMALSVSC